MNGKKRILSVLLCLGLLTAVFSAPAAANELPIIPPHTHTYIYTNNGNGTHTVTCSECDYSATESHTFTNGACVCGAVAPAQQTPYIVSASPQIGENVTLVFKASVPDGYSDPYMVYTFLGTTYTEQEYTVNNEGKYCFALEQMLPQYMGENISAVLHATKNGTEVTDTVAEYSIRQYCVNQLSNNPGAKLRTLLSDLLTYGAAAQEYCGYKTNEPVTAGLSLSPSTFTAISGKTASFTGEADEKTDWKAATLVLNNTLTVRFYFTAENVSGLTVRCAVNGRVQTFTSAYFGTDSATGWRYVDVTGVEATEFDDTVTATFYRNNTQLGRSASYSVNTYVCSTQNSANQNLRALVRALYNYGASASAYAS